MKRIARNLPPDWVPPVPAWETPLPAGTIMSICYVGCQGDETTGGEFRRKVLESLEASGATFGVEYAKYSDRNGVLNTVAVTYWRERSECCAWLGRSFVAHVESFATKRGAGIWIEEFPINRPNIETLFSSDDQDAGIARFAEGEPAETHLHGYYGSMRDRLESSDTDDHASGVNDLIHTPGKSTQRRIEIKAPRKLCAIRSGQNWSHCAGEQREFYLNEIEPVLRAGMNFLRDHPQETGCFDCRYMTETDANGDPLDRSFGYALFKDMADLENWAKSHPTHLAIFDKFMEYALAFDNEIDLKLWHEVLVLPVESVFTYASCAPRTGILGFNLS